MASAEDSLATTLRPRLEVAGADLTRIHDIQITIDDETGTLTLPNDLDVLREGLEATGARAVFIDPVLAHLADTTDSHKDHHVRRMLGPLHRLADEYAIAVLGVMHLNKRERHEMLARVGGSTGFVAAVRSVVALGRDPLDPGSERGSRRVIAHAKCNLGPLQESLSAAIEGATYTTAECSIATSRLVMLGPSTVSANELLQNTPTREERSELDEAIDWLHDELVDGPKLAREVLKRGGQAKHTRRTLYRAKNALRIKSDHIDGIDSRQRAWRLPKGKQ